MAKKGTRETVRHVYVESNGGSEEMPGGGSNSPGPTVRPAWIALAICVMTWVVYLRTAGHPFVQYDDGQYVTENIHVLKGLSLEGIRWAFTTMAASNWHPVTWLSHMMDVDLFGLWPGGHHLVSVLLHTASSLVLFLALRRMTGRPWRSGFAAALFAVHPLHVESVAWVAERKDVLSGLFWMLTMLAHARYAERPSAGRYLAIVAPFALGLMTKPMLVTLPFALLLLDAWPLGRIEGLPGAAGPTAFRFPQVSPARIAAEKIPLLALAAVSSAVTYHVQEASGAVAPSEAYPFPVRLCNALVACARYLGKTAWPADLSVFYPHPGASLPAWQVAGAVLILLCVSVLAFLLLRRSPYVAAGWFWFLGTLVPVIGLVQVGSQAMADRYTYIPLVGLFLVISWGIPEHAARWRLPGLAVPAAAGFVLAALTVTACVQVAHWRSSVTLFTHALRATSGNWLAHNALASSLINEGRFAEGVVHLQEALRIRPDYPLARFNLGVILEREGRIDEAIDQYRRTLRVRPRDAKAHTNLGAALHRMGVLEEAILHYREALRLDPDDSLAHNNLGLALIITGKRDEAISQFREALLINPDYREAAANLRNASGASGNMSP